ncbi:MAG: hypothetical protein PF689_01525 [Deltaproteobacteria bacterium]|jgi:hypothetical protein|nr:hypothetical protein [Deltaproteobacteria bacterium]
MEKVKLFYHNHCFDGAVSVALMQIFLQEYYHKKYFVEYIPLVHAPGFSYDKRMFVADINVILDFVYPGCCEVQWWFDHHPTTFLNHEDRKKFENNNYKGHYQWSPAADSTTIVIKDYLNKKFNFSFSKELNKLIDWVSIIDSACFSSPEIMVEILEPAPAFAIILGLSQNDELASKFIKDLVALQSLEKMSRKPYWSKKINEIRQQNWDLIEDIKENMQIINRIAVINLGNKEANGYNKFIPYYLDSTILYAITLLKYENSFKISLSANPWDDMVINGESHDIGKLCKEHGGGGHFAVGGISFTEKKDAQLTLELIIKTLKEKPVKS